MESLVEKVETLDNRLILNTREDYIQPNGTQSTAIKVVNCLNPSLSQLNFNTSFVRSDIIDSKVQFVNTYVINVNLSGGAGRSINGQPKLGQDFILSPYNFTSNCCGVATLKLNSQITDSKNLSQLVLYNHYLEDSKYALINAMSPSKLDVFNSMANSYLTPNSSFSNFNDATYNNIGNSCYSSCLVGIFTDALCTTPLGNNANVPAGGLALYFKIKTSEWLPLSPFQYDGAKNSKSLSGINTFDLNINVDIANSSRCILSVLAGALINQTGGDIAFNGVSLSSITESQLVFTVLQSPLISGYKIPQRIMYKSLYYDIRNINISAFAGGLSTGQYNNIECNNGVPRYMLVWADTLKSEKAYNQSNFSRYPIQNNASGNFIVNCGGFQNLFASYTNNDLFRMTNRILKKMDYLTFLGNAGSLVYSSVTADGVTTWSYNYANVNTCGSMIACEIGVDVPLAIGLKVGMNVPLRFDIVKYNITDWTSDGATFTGGNPQLNVMFVYEKLTVIDTQSGQVEVNTIVDDVMKSGMSNVNNLVSQDMANSNNNLEGGMLSNNHKIVMNKHSKNAKPQSRIMSFIK